MCFNFMDQTFAANNYKSFTIFDAHGPLTVADGVLFGVGCGLGWYDSKIGKNSSEKNPRSAFLYSVETGGQRADVFRILMERLLLQMVFWLVLAVASASASPPGPRRSPPGPFSAFPASNYPSFLEEITFDEPGRRTTQRVLNDL
jgi:hypothetical protein